MSQSGMLFSDVAVLSMGIRGRQQASSVGGGFGGLGAEQSLG